MGTVIDIAARRRLTREHRIPGLRATKDLVDRFDRFLFGRATGAPAHAMICRRAYTMAEVRAALEDGFETDFAASTDQYFVMVRRP